MATLLNPVGSGRAGSSSLSDDAAATQVVFIDPTVYDYQALLAGLAPGTEAYLLDPQEDGLQQIAAALAGQTGLSSISIIAHGGDGAIRLGDTIVNADTVAHSQAALAAIGASLAPGGDILLDSCDTGAGSTGQALVDQIAAATGANVAASSHLVGDVAAGDGWNLDVTSTGSPMAAPQVLSKAAEDSYAQPLVINGPPTGLPITVTSFTGNTSFVDSGNTTINSSGYLQLTTATNSQAGIAVYSQSFPSTTGVSVQFTYYSGGGTGADGLSFFLLNADAITAAGGTASSVKAGGYGGGLGYSDDGQAGITDGFLGLGFDTFGNFSAVDRGDQTGTGQIANDIGVRGSGSGTTGYSLLSTNPFAAGIDGTRTVKINLLKVDSSHESLSVFVSTNGGSTYTEVITNLSIAQTLPTNFYLGFAASTGGSNDTHEIENLSVTLPVNLTVSAPTVTVPTSYSTTDTLLPGQAFTYSYTITDTGPNGSSEITLLDNASAVETGVTWSVKDDLETQTGTGNINLSNINLASGDSATVTVSGTISSSASTGNASHSITSTPGAAFSFQTPSTGVVELAIGSPNPQLTGTTATASTSGTTAIQPFSAAQVADAHTSPTLTATITLANSAGTDTTANGVLSGTGLTASGTAGVYTLTASTVAAFNSDLEALAFTPTASTKTVGTTIGISVSDGVSGTSPATATTTVTTTCFLAGTRILTEQGEVTVDELFLRRAQGRQDRVAVLEADGTVLRPIAWIGCRRLSAEMVASGGHYPVRIIAGAFAENVPHRDLLVTPEHCIFADGRLVPARMLVNGRSIIEDRSIGSYGYYHIELERHGILISEGLTTESYLDTGNRGGFANDDVVTLALDPSTAAPHDWRFHACAPLATARCEVEPIWQRLDQRADLLGLAPRPGQAALDGDPALRVRLDDGSVLQARWLDGDRHFFQMPHGRRALRLESRSTIPARSVGAFVDDRRRLGVQIGSLVLWQGLDHHAVDAVALDGSGWHELEQDRRWTDGDAALMLPAASDENTFLEVVVVGSLAYPAVPATGGLPCAA